MSVSALLLSLKSYLLNNFSIFKTFRVIKPFLTFQIPIRISASTFREMDQNSKKITCNDQKLYPQIFIVVIDLYLPEFFKLLKSA